MVLLPRLHLLAEVALCLQLGYSHRAGEIILEGRREREQTQQQ